MFRPDYQSRLLKLDIYGPNHSLFDGNLKDDADRSDRYYCTYRRRVLNEHIHRLREYLGV